jgi:capsular polysaccharide biosynthesis protein
MRPRNVCGSSSASRDFAVTEERVESGRYLRALREHWPYIAGTVVLAVTAGVLFVATAHKRYEAGTDVLVTPVPADSFVGVPLFRESDVSRAVVAAARIVKSPEVADRVRARLHLSTGRNDLLSHVSVAPQEQSSILTITGSAASPAQAASIANGFAAALIAERTAELQRQAQAAVGRLSKQLQTLPNGSSAEASALAAQIGALRTLLGGHDPTLQIVSRAVPPETASWPRPVLSIAVALIAGLLLGMGIAVAIELLNPLVLAETDVLERTGPPVLARVPRSATASTEYRGLWANLTSRMADRHAPETVLVTGDERALVAVGLATTLALAGRRVVVVDADAGSSEVEKLLDVKATGKSGVRAALVDDVPVQEALTPVAQFGSDGLRLLTSRPDDEALLGLVRVERFEAFMHDLKGTADVVVIAAPEPANAPDTLELAEGADAVVVAIALGHTHRARVAELRRDLGQRAIVPAGFVIVKRRGLPRSRRPARAASDATALRANEREPVRR